MIDPIVSLAHALHSNKGVYAVLLGSGVSRAAGIPTGWEITLELIRRVAAAEKVKGEISDPATWFLKAKKRDPDYAALLDGLAGTPEERRAILHSFIMPTAVEKDEGKKLPTAAHRAIAKLAARGSIRVIVTTNFDRLMETALKDEGIEPTVIASADAADGAMPLTHAGCVVIKVHGDFMDTRIRNTPPELSSYDPRLNALLDRVLDEFGLIVAGWSGEWDEALRSVFLRCKSRRFTTWWLARNGQIQERAGELIRLRKAQVVSASGADAFFEDLEQRVLSLEELDRPHPLSAQLAIAEIKRFLPDPQHRIRLHDLVTNEVRSAIAQTANLNSQGQYSPAELRKRVETYEAAAEILRPLLATGARWCRPEDEPLFVDAVRRCCVSYRSQAGLVAWVEAQTYLPIMAFYAVGLGAMSVGNYRLLRLLFEAPTVLEKQTVAVDGLSPLWALNRSCELWSSLFNEKRRTPISDRLFQLFLSEIADFVASPEEFAELFDRFEMCAAIQFGHVHKGRTLGAFAWFPVGRFVSRRHGSRPSAALQTWFDEATKLKDGWPPLVCGLFGGTHESFTQLHAALSEFLNSLSRW
ncbi:MAG TPA: SIR2 family protein [Magnetospirillaceae bacterium]|jgi:hypothetical protein